MPPIGFHHVEIWVADLAAVEASWAWLLGQLGWKLYQDWPEGRSWRIGEAYLVVEQSSAVRPPASKTMIFVGMSAMRRTLSRGRRSLQ